MLGITASITAILVFLAFADWRSAPILCLIAALLQDPLRKVTPEQPVYFILLVGIVFAAACLGAWTQNVSFSPGQLFGRDRKITAAMYTLLVIVALEALNSFLRFGNPNSDSHWIAYLFCSAAECHFFLSSRDSRRREANSSVSSCLCHFSWARVDDRVLRIQGL